jgi:hypothetical protein
MTEQIDLTATKELMDRLLDIAERQHEMIENTRIRNLVNSNPTAQECV